MARSLLKVASVLFATVGVVTGALPACSSKFSSCESSRSCTPTGGGGGELDSPAAAGADDETDAPGAAGQASDPSGNDGRDEPSEAGAAAIGDVAEAGAGGRGPISNGSAGDRAASSDTVPPKVVGITPIDGATGLSPTTDIITISFSEPMDESSVESAFVPTGDRPEPTFTWNGDSTELKIDPNLTYPTATDPASQSQPYGFTLTTAASDLAGNRLAAESTLHFSLLREITQSFVVYRVASISSDGSLFLTKSAVAGDTAENVQERGFIQAGIASLPQGIETFERATLNTNIATIAGDPFGQFGNMLLQSVSLSATYPDTNDFAAPPLRELGALFTASGNHAVGDAASKDVLSAVQDDYKNRAARKDLSTYRVLFNSAPNSNGAGDSIGVVQYVSGQSTSTLVVTYLYP